MFKNYLKIALRNLKRQKLFTLINISGLAIGMALFTLATLYSDFNFSYDQHSEDSEYIYIPTQIIPSGKGGERHSMFTPAPLGPLMAEQFPEVAAVTRHIPLSKQIVKYADKKFYESKVWVVDPNFIDFFNFELNKTATQALESRSFYADDPSTWSSSDLHFIWILKESGELMKSIWVLSCSHTSLCFW